VDPVLTVSLPSYMPILREKLLINSEVFESCVCLRLNPQWNAKDKSLFVPWSRPTRKTEIQCPLGTHG
jgi:hypothetical protein